MATTSERAAAELEHLLGERRGPGAADGDRHRLAGARIDDADAVHAVGDVSFRRLVAGTLGRHAVHDDGRAEASGLAQRRLDRADVVAIDRADVLQAEVFEHRLRLHQILDAPLDAVQRVIQRWTDERGAREGGLDHVQHLLVLRREAQAGEVLGEPAERRGVRAAVVVDDDDHRALGDRDVVQRLPAIPPVSAPSPITATTWRVSPGSAYALAMPSAYDSAVDAWEFSTWSCSGSDRLG